MPRWPAWAMLAFCVACAYPAVSNLPSEPGPPAESYQARGNEPDERHAHGTRGELREAAFIEAVSAELCIGWKMRDIGSAGTIDAGPDLVCAPRSREAVH